MDTATNPTDTDDQNQQEQPRSWRDVLPIHPAAELLPLMSADELRELADDIKENGLLEKVELTEQDGVLMLLDGRNRLDALQLLGREIFVSQYDLQAISLDRNRMTWRKRKEAVAADKDRDASSHEFCQEVYPENPFAYVLSKNIHRRHLTPEQKRPATIELVKRSAELSNALLAEMADVDDHEIADIRAELESTSEIPRLEKLIGRDGRARPAKLFRSRAGCTGVAELLNRLDDEAPEPVEQVEMAAPEDATPYDPAADEVTEATMDEMLADPEHFWDSLTYEANKRLQGAFHAAREARSNEDHAAEHQALCDLIAAASEIKKFYEDHNLLAGRGLQ